MLLAKYMPELGTCDMKISFIVWSNSTGCSPVPSPKEIISKVLAAKSHYF